MLALVKAWHDERFIISQLVRIACANIAFASTWSLLQSPDVTDGQLAILQTDWEELTFALPMENALTMERAIAGMTMERMRNSSAEFQKTINGFGGGGGGGATSGGDWMEKAGELVGRGVEATKNKAKESAWRVSWSLTDELKSLKGAQVALDTIRAARSNGCYHAALQEQSLRLEQLGITGKSNDDWNLLGNEPDLRNLFSDSIAVTAPTLVQVMRAETDRQVDRKSVV